MHKTKFYFSPRMISIPPTRKTCNMQKVDFDDLVLGVEGFSFFSRDILFSKSLSSPELTALSALYSRLV